MKTKILAIAIISILLGIVIFPAITSSPIKGLEVFEDSSCYGFIISVNSNQNYSIQNQISCMINNVLRENLTVYWIKSDMTFLSKGLKENDSVFVCSFKKGSFIVPFAGQNDIDLNMICGIYQCSLDQIVPVYKIMEPLNNFDAYMLVEPKIALYAGDAADTFSYYDCLKIKGGFLNFVSLTHDEVINNLTTKNYNVFIWGGQAGSYDEVIKDNVNPNASIVNEKIRNFVSDGGGYISSCYGSYKASSGLISVPSSPRGILFPALSKLTFLKIIDRPVSRALPGGGGGGNQEHGDPEYNHGGFGVDVRFVNSDNPVSFGLDEIVKNHLYLAGPMFLEKKFGSSNTETLAVIEGIHEEHWNWDFMMDMYPLWEVIPQNYKERIINRWVNYSIGKALWVTSKYGDGKVVAFGGHPEYDNARTPPRIVYNAVYYTCSKGPYTVSLENSVSFSKVQVSATAQNKANIFSDISFYGEVINGTSPYHYCWDFGYGNQKFTLNTVYSYDHLNTNYNPIGNHTIIFGAVDSEGFFAVDNLKIKIVECVLVKVQQNIYTGYINEPVIFSATTSRGIEPYTWLWDFGDGTNSTEQNPTHTYSTVGQYYCEIMVYDKYNGCSGDCFKVIINKPDNGFTASINISPIPQAINKNVTISVNVSKPGEYWYYIDFGDHDYYSSNFTDETSISVNHVYGWGYDSGYNIIVKVENSSGGSYIALVKGFKVNVPPYRPWSDIPTVGRLRKKISFEIRTGDHEKEDVWFRIDFGDGYIDENNETTTFVRKDEYGYTYYDASYKWKKPGEYQIKFQAIDQNGFESEWSVPQTIIITRFPRIIHFFNLDSS